MRVERYNATTPRLTWRDAESHHKEVLDTVPELPDESFEAMLAWTRKRPLARLWIRDGKTSSEFVLKESYRAALAAEESSLDAGTAVARAGPGTEETHEEFILLDRVGRLQLRREDMELLGIKANSRLRVTVEDGRIVIRPADDPTP